MRLSPRVREFTTPRSPTAAHDMLGLLAHGDGEALGSCQRPPPVSTRPHLVPENLRRRRGDRRGPRANPVPAAQVTNNYVKPALEQVGKRPGGTRGDGSWWDPRPTSSGEP